MKVNHALLAQDFPEVRTFWIGRTDDTDSMRHLQLILDANAIIHPEQTHSANVSNVTVENYESEFTDTDALITSERKLAIGIKTADCVPVLIYDPTNKIIAAAHAGWRGTVGRIIENVLTRMQEMGSVTADLYAHIGVAISRENYEVGEDVIEQFTAKGFEPYSFGERNPKTGKFHIDLREANKQMLIKAGVPEKQITTSNTCTFYSPLCYSARRDGIDTGRNFTGIMLK